MAYRAAVAGASGYTGAELLRLLEGHPGFSTTVGTSREFAGRNVADVYPNLRTDLTYSELDPAILEDPRRRLRPRRDGWETHGTRVRSVGD